MFINPQETLAACNLQVTDTVADFGAGNGFITFYIAEHLAQRGTLFAIEIQRDMVTRIAREAEEKSLQNVHALWGDIELVGGTGLKEASVDFVILANILFQLDDKETVFKEAKRVLKKGGRVLVIDWTDSFNGLGPAPQHVFVPTLATELLIKNGFELLNAKLPVGDHHYAILARAV